MKWHDTELPPLSPIEAYDAMGKFLEAYWKRGGSQSNDIAVLLSDIGRNTRDDFPPIDIAQWDDWLNAVKDVQGGRQRG